jgi:hypothetical protein
MPVLYTPPYAPNSQYRPNLFVTYQPSANPLVLAVAEIYVDGITLTTTIKKSYAYVVGSAPANYYFEFDVSKILQSVSAPNAKQITSVFAKDLNIAYNVVNNDCHTSVAIIVKYYYIDPITNLLTQLVSGTPPAPVIDVLTSGYFATIGTRQTAEYMGLNSYAMAFPTLPNVYDKYFLTNLPSVDPQAAVKTNNPIPICNGDNLTMSYIPDANTNAIRIVIYDTNQDFVNPAGFISVTPNSTLTPRTFGAGIVQLAALIQPTDATFAARLLALKPNEYYSVQVGNLIMAGFIPQGVKYMFKVVDCCANKVRLHWLNRLGGSDAYTFTNKKIVSESNSSTLAQKAQSWILTAPSSYSFDKGRFKIQQTATKEYEVESTFYDVSWGEWLAELLSSPEVYMETPAGLIAVVITDSSIKIEETNELVNVNIKFIESNNISVQQN